MASDKKLSAWIVSLGCPKNRVDTERLLGSLGLGIKNASSIGRAELVFINTCAFIEPACRESLRVIFDIGAQLKKLKRKPLFVVAGCLPGRYGIDTLAIQIPEVDLWLDSKSIAEWPQMLNEELGLEVQPLPGRLIVNGSYAWLKIAEGCQRRCTFCAIPSIRGPLKSVPAMTIMEEAAEFIASGAKELVLVAQDVTAWGRDLIIRGTLPFQAGGAPLCATARDLPDLLLNLRRLNGLVWLRLMYLYPNSVSTKLLEVMGEGLPILPYLDLPFQHCQKNLLMAMGRRGESDPYEIVDKIRRLLPKAALRATLMTGYPGETEKDFMALCEFVRDVRFQNLGVFPFMAEEGTKAATLSDQIPDKIKEERADEIMRIQAEISSELLDECVGTKMDVLVDKDCGDEWPGLYSGRVWFQAPEVDGVTYISGNGVEVARMLQADIVDSQTYDLSGLV